MINNADLKDLQSQLNLNSDFSEKDEQIIREYYQRIIIKKLYNTEKDYKNRLAFLGGTVLRLVYNTNRYSEDLDFSLYNYTEKDLTDIIRQLKELESEYSAISLNADVKDKTAVFKLFIKIGDLRGLGFQKVTKDKNIKIKFEFDTNPPSICDNKLEKINFNGVEITVHNKKMLKSGKLSAVLFRTYLKGRDYYDLDLYLNDERFKDIPFDPDYITKNIEQQNLEFSKVTDKDIEVLLKKKIDDLENDIVLQKILSDLDKFVYGEERERIFTTIKKTLKEGYEKYYGRE